MNDELLLLKNQLCFRLYSVSRNMTRVYQPLLQAFNLTYPQYIIMLILLEHKSMDFKELSQMIDLKTGTMTPIIQKMEEIGYVKKAKNPEDGRRITVYLTEAGEALKEKLVQVPIALAGQIDYDLDSYYNLVAQLDVLMEKLQNAQIKE